MKNEIKILIAAIIVILIILVGAYALKGNNSTPSVTPTAQPVITPTPTPTPTMVATPTPTPTVTPTPSTSSNGGIIQTQYGYVTTKATLGPENWSSPPNPPTSSNPTPTPSLPYVAWGTGFPGNQYPPGSVEFVDMSYSMTGPIISWFWSFGDGTTSNVENPIHTFPSPPRTFTVSLTVTNAVGSNTATGNVYA